MKIKLVKKYTKIFFLNITLIIISVYINACGPSPEKYYNEAYAEIEKGHFRVAINLLEKSVDLDELNITKYKHLLEAARIARFEIQDYERAIRIYRKIILQSQNESQRISAQQAISEIYLENLFNYNKALKELQILEPLTKSVDDKEKLKLKIAMTQFLIGNLDQALEEINTALTTTVRNETLNFLKIKAQVLVAQKKYKEALSTYLEIFNKDINYFEKENLFIATSIVYEENEEYKEALEYLVKYEKQIKDKAYYELRFKRLKERLVNKPFYKGKRK